MIEETATVVSCENNLARLSVQRQTSCGSCNLKSGCGTSVFSETLGKKVSQVTVENTLDLHEGDRVIVGLHESALLAGSFMVYFLPLILLLGSALLGQWLSGVIFTGNSELPTILFAVFGFVVGLKLVRYFSVRVKDDERFKPVLIRKLLN